MTRRRLLALAALVAAQALLPLALIGWNELALASGTHVTLRTAPVDPVDLFRGRYVALSYELTSLDAPYPAGTVVYVPLRDAGQAWIASGPPTRSKPGGTVIRGRVTDSGLSFGIERFFVDEDEAPRLERAGPLLADVVLDDDGGARITGLRAVR